MQHFKFTIEKLTHLCTPCNKAECNTLRKLCFIDYTILPGAAGINALSGCLSFKDKNASISFHWDPCQIICGEKNIIKRIILDCRMTG